MYKKIIPLLLMLSILAIGGVSFAGASDPLTPIDSSGKVSVAHPPEEGLSIEFNNPDLESNHYSFYGLNWLPQKPNVFSQIKHDGAFGGTRFKVNKPGVYRIYMGLPIENVLNGVQRKIRYAQLCGQSSNYHHAYPAAWALLEGDSAFFAEVIYWGDNNQENCVTTGFNPATWRNELAIMVMLHFDNTSDTFILKNVSIRTTE